MSAVRVHTAGALVEATPLHARVHTAGALTATAAPAGPVHVRLHTAGALTATPAPASIGALAWWDGTVLRSAKLYQVVAGALVELPTT